MFNLQGIDLKQKSRGFSLVELMVTVAIIAIAFSVAVPSITNSVETQRISGAARTLDYFFLQARSEAAKKNAPVSVVFTITSATDWCIGLSDTTPDCDCNEEDACAIDGKELVIFGSDYPQVRLETTRNPITIEPVRGRGQTSSVSLELNGKELDVRRSIIGRTRVCSPDSKFGRYDKC